MIRFFIAFTYLAMVFYGYGAIKTLFRARFPKVIYFLLTLGVFLYFLIEIFWSKSAVRNNPDKISVFAIFFSFYVLVLILAGVMLLEDVFRVFESGYKHLKAKSVSTEHWPSRREFVSKIALVLGALPFGALLYGIFEGRYNYRVVKYVLEFDDLPKDFEGYQITHISDIHCGGLNNTRRVEYAVDLINEQKSNVILFTGDFIDRKTDELYQWKDLFAKMKAEDGKYSILGNHDYGHYFYRWESDWDRANSFNEFKRVQKKMGFALLCDENLYLKKGEGKLALIGVENWKSDSMDELRGNVDTAIKGVNKDDFKILLSHDPNYWEDEIIDHDQHFHLTLSGHTHGYQFGIEIPGYFQWTPFNRRFKYWAGLYKEKGQFINVNRGLGSTSFPARLGIWPEISVITLKKKIS